MAGAALRIDPGWRIAAAALAWCAGIACQLQQAVLLPRSWMIAATLAALLVLAAIGAWQLARTRSFGIAFWVMLPALFILAFASTAWRAGELLAQRLDPALEGADLVVVGVIAQMPQLGPSGARLRFDVESARLRERTVHLPARLSLAWFRGLHDEALLAGPGDEQGLRAGQRWRLPVRLRRPHGLFNPHGFDLELWLFEQGVMAGGYVRVRADGPQPELLAEAVAHPVERARQGVREAIWRQVGDARAAGVLAALAVGDQAAIERDDWDLFRNTGVAHLMSISGLHVTMFAWGAGLLIGWIWRRSARAMLRLPAPLAARWGGLAVALMYAVFAGWGVPAQRTVLMLAAAVVLRNSALNWPWPLVLLVAGALVLALDPWALLQAGFWLSFAAVGLLMLSQAPQREPSAGWRSVVVGHLRTQVVATLGLAPLTLVFFQQVSVVGFVANLVAIPLVTLLITPLALLGALVPVLWWPAAALVQGLSGLLAALASWPAAVLVSAAAPTWGIVCGLLAGLLAVMPLPWRMRLLALPLALPLLWPPVARPQPGRFELVAADVGQGNAVLIRTRHHLLVYDSGPQYGLDSDAGQRVLLPLLRARGESRIDLLMLSHRDSDHVGGAASLVSALSVTALASSLSNDHPLLARGLPHSRCDAGQRWQWDGVEFEVLHPLPEEHADARKPNALSCVLRVRDELGRSALLTADIEAAQEAALLARLGERLRSTVLMVPHHGSRSSSSLDWLRAVQPEVAFVQAAYRSRFGHPAAEVVQRYQALGIALARSDRCGAWTWRDGQALCERDLRRRYWHWQEAAPAD